jgi:3-hydroxyisobutyrate dehydrogenase-like beta-hydroxyacid dehydrogenase
MSAALQNICIVGFGEVGGIFASDLTAQNRRVAVYDILIHESVNKEALQAKAARTRAVLCSSLADAISEADLVVSAVTASSAPDVARSCAPLLRRGQWFIDINSVSPETKRENSRVVEQSGAIYVEAAVMAPVPPQRLKVPMLLGGAKAAELRDGLVALGMNVQVASDRVGVASAIKMCRSIMIKGLEALTVECMFAARRYDAETAVLASLQATFPSMGWSAELPDYLISRAAEHGRRRAAEMREVAQTVAAIGLPPLMASAIAQRHDALIDAMEKAGCLYDSAKKFSWRELADRLAGR